MRCLIVTEERLYAHHLCMVLQDGPVDAVVLDVSTRSRTKGATLVRAWSRRLRGQLPLLVIHAPEAHRDVPALVNAGASGCHDRGEDARVLLARLQRQLLRWQGYSGPAMRRGALCVHIVTREVMVGGASLQLSPLEFGVLTVLMFHYLRVLSRDDVLLRLYQALTTTGRHRVLDVIVGRLRKKLADHGLPIGVCTVWRSGYVLDFREVCTVAGCSCDAPVVPSALPGKGRRRARSWLMPVPP